MVRFFFTLLHCADKDRGLAWLNVNGGEPGGMKLILLWSTLESDRSF